jgi:hypothetical protein
MAAEQQQQDGSKTLVSFVVGLLIGGMLVWAFSGPSAVAPADEVSTDEASEMTAEAGDEAAAETETATDEVVEKVSVLPVGNGSIVVDDQPASTQVTLSRATYPIEEGWIGVRDFNNGQLGFIKGVVRFSAAGNRVPENIVLQAPTQVGQVYAVVVFSDNGDNAFNPAGDVQIDEIFATFTAQ